MTSIDICFLFTQDDPYYVKKRDKIDRIIGHGLQYIAPFQLRTFMCLLYGFINYDQLTRNKPDSSYFAQKLVWEDGTKTTNYLPPIKCPSSTVTFWVKRLDLYDRSDIKCFDNYGLSSCTELVAELKGLYSFYSKAR